MTPVSIQFSVIWHKQWTMMYSGFLNGMMFSFTEILLSSPSFRFHNERATGKYLLTFS